MTACNLLGTSGPSGQFTTEGLCIEFNAPKSVSRRLFEGSLRDVFNRVGVSTHRN